MGRALTAVAELAKHRLNHLTRSLSEGLVAEKDAMRSIEVSRRLNAQLREEIAELDAWLAAQSDKEETVKV